MTCQLFQFAWQTPCGDLAPVWVDRRVRGVGGELRVLAYNQRHPESSCFRAYQPLYEVPSLFRIFADTEPTCDGILKFVRRYGPLGKGASVLLPPNQDSEVMFPGPVRGFTTRDEWLRTRNRPLETEPLAGWQWLIPFWRHLLQLWDLAESGDQKGLSQCIKLASANDPSGVDTFTYPPKPTNLPADWMSSWSSSGVYQRDSLPFPVLPRDLRVLAKYFVHLALDEWLQELTTARLVWDPSNNKPVLFVMPHSLFGAMVFQFATTIDENKQYVRCLACRRWYEVGTGVGRSHKITCSPTCRVRLHRMRKEAAELRAAGKSFPAIAKELKVEIQTVKRIIAKMR